ncbi:hypothetical protein Htur_0618 [Haloterrigena turkmenica DSM 5511]|uniref:Uncharacterized protein n=1 Tax=Haloterrigena turkmenica (strain ATCC 51198 / DSM 5511 / JCM 9101 / NCIMB 13204 / VKM B-1734 / 4k) TaxID=543526 RepID=D2RWC7_HALTV|nr:hypothetical protein [Haloterrigena turkmenica]ADB59516.1 hypothetical protein Htur_0618 [Haloterrigena turkmenica DSM 5511]
MATDSGPSDPDVTAAFERDLEALVTTAFGRGAVIDGVWDVSSPVSAAPAWTVTIERREPDPDSDPAFEPEFLED